MRPSPHPPSTPTKASARSYRTWPLPTEQPLVKKMGVHQHEPSKACIFKQPTKQKTAFLPLFRRACPLQRLEGSGRPQPRTSGRPRPAAGPRPCPSSSAQCGRSGAPQRSAGRAGRPLLPHLRAEAELRAARRGAEGALLPARRGSLRLSDLDVMLVLRMSGCAKHVAAPPVHAGLFPLAAKPRGS